MQKLIEIRISKDRLATRLASALLRSKWWENEEFLGDDSKGGEQCILSWLCPENDFANVYNLASLLV